MKKTITYLGKEELKVHKCPKCGNDTDGVYSEGGVKWAICDDCMCREEREAERRYEYGIWYNDNLSI